MINRPTRLAARRPIRNVAAEPLETRRLMSASYASVSTTPGTGGNDLSVDASISGDGKRVVFASRATNLVAGFTDNNGPSTTDLFLRDLTAGTTTLISRAAASATAVANGTSKDAVISADGKFVVFVSGATNLKGAAGNGLDQVYRYEVATGDIELISATNSGNPGNAQSYAPAVSRDGRFVVFSSLAANIGPAQGAGTNVVYLWDATTGDLDLVSRRSDESIARKSARASVSDDGRYVTFSTDLSNDVFGPVVVPEDENGVLDVFLRDRTAGTTVLVSRRPDGKAGDALSDNARISGDGSTVVFESDASDLESGDGNGLTDVYAYDVASGVVTRMSSYPGGQAGTDRSEGPTVSADGRYVAFVSRADELSDGGQNFENVFVRDRSTGTLTMVGGAAGGGLGSASDDEAFISADGQWVAFQSQSTNLDEVVTDGNGSGQDVFVAPRAPTPAGPDLTISALSGAAGTYAAGASVPLSATVANVGGADAGAFTVRFALSTDRTFDGGDLVLGEAAVAGVAAGGQAAATATGTFPAGATAGPYYLVATADAATAVTEADEGNNAAAGLTADVAGPGGSTGAVNLVAETLTYKLKSTAVVAGSKAPKASLRVANAGAATAQGVVTIRVVASADGVVDGNDVEVVTVENVKVKLKAGKAKTFKVKLGTFPQPAVDGDYTLLATIDAGNAIGETNESDNTAAGATVNIAAPFVDLRPTAAVQGVPATLSAGDKVSLVVPVTNSGNVAVKATTEVRVVAVTADADALLAGTVFSKPLKLNLKPGKVSNVKLKFRADELPAAGTYFLVVQLDASNVVGESDEANNAADGDVTTTVA